MRTIYWIASLLSQQQPRSIFNLIRENVLGSGFGSSRLPVPRSADGERGRVILLARACPRLDSIYHRVCENVWEKIVKRGGAARCIQQTKPSTDLFSPFPPWVASCLVPRCVCVCVRTRGFWDDSAGAADGWTGQRLQSSGISLIGPCYREDESARYRPRVTQIHHSIGTAPSEIHTVVAMVKPLLVNS